jgi:hypothetical protein
MDKLISSIVLSVVIAVCGGTAFLTPVYASGHNLEVLADYIAVVLGTAKYHNVNQAIADGYVEGACEDGRGVAFSNPALIADPEINAAKPEFLLYDLQVTPNGREKLKLRGVAYFVVGNEPLPIFGEPFLNPPGTNIYFTHVWVWLEGPRSDLLVSRYHPRVGCE